MDDLLHDTLDVAVALRKVEGAELRRRLVVVGVRFELKKFVNKSQDIHNNA